METIQVPELVNPVPLAKIMLKIVAMAFALLLITIVCFIPMMLVVPMTTYSPGLQMNRFDNRLVGMTRDEVIAIHGPPLSILIYSSITPLDRARRPVRNAPYAKIEPILARINCPHYYLGQGAPFPYVTSEHWRYSDREGGMVWRQLVVSVDSQSGKVSSVWNAIYHE